MKTIVALATASALIATVAQATVIVSDHRMLAESFVSAGDKTYVVGLRGGAVNTSNCCGVLITKKHVLTSTQCSGWMDTAYVGENTGDSLTNGESIRVIKTTDHPKARDSRYDYAIFELERESKFTPVSLADRHASAYAGKKALSFGWNTAPEKSSAKNVLLKNTNTIHSQAHCKNDTTIGLNLGETLFCAGGGSTVPKCLGYYGGPIVIERPGKPDLALGKVYRSEGCSGSTAKVKGAAGIYSEAFAVKEWIQKNAPDVKFE